MCYYVVIIMYLRISKTLISRIEHIVASQASVGGTGCRTERSSGFGAHTNLAVDRDPHGTEIFLDFVIGGLS